MADQQPIIAAVIQDYAASKFVNAADAREHMISEIAALRAQVERLQAAGQVAAPAMVPVSDSGIDDLAEALLEVTTSEVVSPESARAFARAVESISAKLNGLTVGDRQASGRVD